MLESQREKLRTFPRKTLSLGITPGSEPRRSIPIPWELTGSAYNMCTPDVYLAPEDLADEALWALLEPFEIVGCYIFSPLTDYTFLHRLTELRDLTIRMGFFLPDLGFLTAMPGWRLLHIEDAVVPDLAPLFPKEGPQVMGRCLCLSGCTVGDISALEREDVRLSELVILAPEGSRERSRWSKVRCGKYSYFEYRVKG